MDAPPPELARRWLRDLVAAWQASRQHALPLALETALAWLSTSELRDASVAFEGSAFAGSTPGERDRDASLRRVYPDFDSLLDGLTDTPRPADAGCSWAQVDEPDAGDDASGLEPDDAAGFLRWSPLYRPLLDWSREFTHCRPLHEVLDAMSARPEEDRP